MVCTSQREGCYLFSISQSYGRLFYWRSRSQGNKRRDQRNFDSGQASWLIHQDDCQPMWACEGRQKGLSKGLLHCDRKGDQGDNETVVQIVPPCPSIRMTASQVRLRTEARRIQEPDKTNSMARSSTLAWSHVLTKCRETLSQLSIHQTINGGISLGSPGVCW